MKYDPDKRRIPVHLHFSRLIAKEAQERQEWVLALSAYLVAMGNLVEQIAVATQVEFEIMADWHKSTVTLTHDVRIEDSPNPTLAALHLLDKFCNQQLRYKLEPSGAWTALAHLPANLGNNAFHIEIFDPGLQLGALIPKRTAKEAQP